MDDAAARVSKYLLMQVVVNMTYRISIAIARHWIILKSPFITNGDLVVDILQR